MKMMLLDISYGYGGWIMRSNTKVKYFHTVYTTLHKPKHMILLSN